MEDYRVHYDHTVRSASGQVVQFLYGEDGMDGIALGSEYPGCTYVDFQKRILALQQRGFILALCSKNNEA